MLAGEHSYRVLWITLGFAASMHGALHYDMTLSQTCSSLDSALLDRDIASLVALAFAWYREAPCCDVKLFTTQAFETALVLHGAPMRRGCSTLYPDECGPFFAVAIHPPMSRSFGASLVLVDHHSCRPRKSCAGTEMAAN